MSKGDGLLFSTHLFPPCHSDSDIITFYLKRLDFEFSILYFDENKFFQFFKKDYFADKRLSHIITKVKNKNFAKGKIDYQNYH